MSKNLLTDTISTAQDRDEALAIAFADLKRQFEELKANQAPTLYISNTSQASFPLVSGDAVTVTTTFVNAEDKSLFAFPQVSVFKDSVSLANLWPNGSNWGSFTVRYLKVMSWLDWAETDNTILVFKTLLINDGLTDYNLIYKINWKYLLPGSS